MTEPPTERVRLCLQCGKCTGLCPAARFHAGFNPRRIVLDWLTGEIDAYLDEDSVIWACCVCLACDHYCPQDVKPHEVVSALRERAYAAGVAPATLTQVMKAVRERGLSVAVGRGAIKRRQSLGLGEISLSSPAQLFAESDHE